MLISCYLCLVARVLEKTAYVELLTDISNRDLCLQLKQEYETLYGIPRPFWQLAIMCNRKRKDAKVQLLSVSGEEDAKDKEVLG